MSAKIPPTTRLSILGVGVLSLALLAAVPARAADPAPAGAPATPAQIVDALNKAFGVHPGFRANHAKGVVATGTFTPSPDAAVISRAALFKPGTIPVTVRFSDSTGIPNIPDGVPGASPHGLSMKFHLPGGHDVDIVINSLSYFPVATGTEFRDLLLAVVASPPDAAKPTALDTFFAAHPAAPGAFGALRTPDSFADEQYNGVNSFIFIDAAGKRTPFRLVALPEKLVHLDPAEAAKMPPDFLIDELPQRLSKGPVVFHLKAQLAGPGDSITDATKKWPDDRPVVELGTLSIDTAAPDSLAAQKKLLFLPTNLTDGIEPSDDPLIRTRSGAYAVSFSRRLH